MGWVGLGRKRNEMYKDRDEGVDIVDGEGRDVCVCVGGGREGRRCVRIKTDERRVCKDKRDLVA